MSFFLFLSFPRLHHGYKPSSFFQIQPHTHIYIYILTYLLTYIYIYICLDALCIQSLAHTRAHVSIVLIKVTTPTTPDGFVTLLAVMLNLTTTNIEITWKWYFDHSNSSSRIAPHLCRSEPCEDVVLQAFHAGFHHARVEVHHNHSVLATRAVDFLVPGIGDMLEILCFISVWKRCLRTEA